MGVPARSDGIRTGVHTGGVSADRDSGHSKQFAGSVRRPTRGAAQAPAVRAPTWWSRALGRAPGDPALVGNSDDRIVLAQAAGLLDARDLRALDDLIAQNRLDEHSSPFDRNDGDGILAAWEVGFQIWQDGRLVLLSFGPDPHSSFQYPLEWLPDSFEDLDGLRYLGLQQNALQELPPGIGRLHRLEQLIASDNRLTSLPRSIGELQSLERLVLSDNRLETLPSSMGRLNALTALHLPDNRLASLPPSLFQLPRLRTLDLRQQPGAGDLVPSDLAATRLEEIYVAGHPTLCGAGLSTAAHTNPANGSTLRVYGAASGGCASR
jgi:hypothetical protein